MKHAVATPLFCIPFFLHGSSSRSSRFAVEILFNRKGAQNARKKSDFEKIGNSGCH
jgi:hypothetical protein